MDLSKFDKVAIDKSLFIYAGVSHIFMADPKGHMIGNTVYEEFEF